MTSYSIAKFILRSNIECIICQRFFYLLFLNAEIVDGHRIEFMASARGRLKLVIDDFPFCQNEVHAKKTYYICSQKRVLRFVF